jgi:DNA-binding NtrC family response regulator
MSPAKDERASRVLLLGCPSLSRPLRARGLRVASIRSVGQLLKPKVDLDARAIVIRAQAIGRQAMSEIIPQIRAAWPLVDVLLWAPNASGAVVREGLHAGAADVLLNESPERCSQVVADVLAAQQLLPRAARPQDEQSHGADFEGMTSRSPAMWELFDTASQVASTEATVIILGETGTGKELLARAIHRRSGRSGRFVAVHCGAIPEGLIDSELFGHVEGAFTGAKSAKPGLFRYADGGTLMLDEMGTIPLAAQYRLLRVLQEGAVRAVGGHEETPVDVRVVAATNSDLEEDVRRGRFREDLFYRLDVIRLVIPPLRERPEDIIFLFGLFARRIAEQYNIDRPALDEGFLNRLVEYEWPGNVRQLENFTEQLLLTHPNRRLSVVALEKLLRVKDTTPRDGRPSRLLRVGGAGGDVAIDTSRPIQDIVDPVVSAVERAYLDACLDENQGRVGAAAAQAGISRRTLLRKMQQYGIDKNRFRHRTRDDGGQEDETTAE